MALGQKGLTGGAIKGLTVCCFTMWAVFHCKHTTLVLLCRAIQSSVIQVSSLKEILGDRWVPASNQRPRPG
ncbi:unnamed protein product, partial [Staurois parvus]